MQYDLGTEQSLDVIFAGILVGGLARPTDDMPENQRKELNKRIRDKSQTWQYCQAAFLNEFPTNVFQDRYAFLYEAFKTKKDRWFNGEQLRTIVNQNRDLILDSPYIDLTKYSVTTSGGRSQDDEIIAGFTADLMEKFTELSNTVVTHEQFETSIRVFKQYYIQQRSLEISQNCTMILSSTGFVDKQPGHKSVQLRGVQDSRDYYAREHQKLKALEEGGTVRDTVIDRDWLVKEARAEDEKDEDYLCDFGLTDLDAAMGGIRKRRMYGVLGPPKGGKTRFTNYLVGRLLAAGFNVAVWPLEGTKDEWTAIQVAYILNSEFQVNIPSDVVFERRYGYAVEDGRSSDEIRAKVMSAKTLLALGNDDIDSNKRRGRLSFIEGSAYEEDFLDAIETHYKTRNAFDVLVMDQIVNILGRSRKAKSERISDAYVKLHDFIQNKLPCCMLAPAQLKQDTIDYLRRNPDQTIDVTAGGESAETIRTPDEVIGLMSNKEERAAGIMKLYHVASRHGASFDDVFVRAELGWVRFYDDPGLNQ